MSKLKVKKGEEGYEEYMELYRQFRHLDKYSREETIKFNCRLIAFMKKYQHRYNFPAEVIAEREKFCAPHIVADEKCRRAKLRAEITHRRYECAVDNMFKSLCAEMDRNGNKPIFVYSRFSRKRAN